jgi:LuxR family maltose regulon positive regulatory protein
VVEEAEIRTWLDAGEIHQAESMKTIISNRLPASIEAELLVRQRLANEALTVIEHALPEALNTSSLEVVRLMIVRSQALFMKNEHAQALTCLKQTLELAEPDCRIASFFRQGPALEPLLRMALSRSIAPEFIRRLLAALEARRGVSAVKALTGLNASAVLTRRELEILNLLALGLSDKEIAEHLVIARETVHKHLKNIYMKLDVHSRTAAIARANEMGMIKIKL